MLGKGVVMQPDDGPRIKAKNTFLLYGICLGLLALIILGFLIWSGDMAEFIQFFFLIYTLLLFVRILTSWIPELHELSIMEHICQVTDPYLALFRSIIPPIGMMDISPLFAFIALHFMEQLCLMLVV